jgi:hypothetical protein
MSISTCGLASRSWEGQYYIVEALVGAPGPRYHMDFPHEEPDIARVAFLASTGTKSTW